MAEPKSSKPTSESPASSSGGSKRRDEGVQPQSVYVGGESIADRLLPHAKKILVTIGVIAAIVGVYLFYEFWVNRKKAKATNALMAALAENRLDIEEPDPTAEPPDPNLPPPPRTHASEVDRATATLAALAKVGGDQRKSVALLEAQLLLETGRRDEANKVYQGLVGKSDLEGVLAREGLAYTAEAAALELEPGDARDAGLRDALELYRSAQPDEDGPRRDYVYYNEGRLLMLLGDKPGAKAAFEKAAAKASTSLESSIEVRLAQLEAKEVPVLPAPKPPEPEPVTPPTETPPTETPPAETPPPAATTDAGT